MNTAEYTATPRPTVASLAHASAQENSLYAQFARPCIRSGGWETLSGQYLAMKEECAKRRLRACSFPHFREVVRRFNKVGFPNRCSHPYGYGAMSVSRRPKLDFLDLTAGWRWAGKSGQ
ncbi:hypothetical protein [Rhizobium leguminosarum]|uniref:hypothetical protein n=1 Tax=Rhizobium leguminosarum TaxID=384 RepID=UPI001030C828|nr:hypothetical protein [Rhizobium leguminosarum]TAX38913.1 hypothetical protein ELI05_08055 [Rhizobium leguminosarum]